MPTANKELPVPLLVSVLALVVLVLGFFAWRTFGPQPEPGAGMTPQQKAQAMLEAGKKIKPRSSGLFDK